MCVHVAHPVLFMFGIFPERESWDAHSWFKLPPNRKEESELLRLEVLELRVSEVGTGTSIRAEKGYPAFTAFTSSTVLSEFLRMCFAGGSGRSSGERSSLPPSPPPSPPFTSSLVSPAAAPPEALCCCCCCELLPTPATELVNSGPEGGRLVGVPASELERRVELEGKWTTLSPFLTTVLATSSRDMGGGCCCCCCCCWEEEEEEEEGESVGSWWCWVLAGCGGEDW